MFQNQPDKEGWLIFFAPYRSIGELEYKLAFEYNITYESSRSYYDLFDAAGISCQKTTKLNPKADTEAVAVKKKQHCYIAGKPQKGNRNRNVESIATKIIRNS